MALSKKFSLNLQSACSLVIMIVIWLAFAPRQVGGMASYIIVIGNSMEPRFHIGDLVITHRQPVYRVGDAVVYENGALRSYVFHRIIAQQFGRYTLQGDNNSWIDTYRPTDKEILGKLWLHIPHGGQAIQRIRTPWAMALIAGAMGAGVATSWSRKKSKGNTPMKETSLREWFVAGLQKARTVSANLHLPEPETIEESREGKVLETLFFVLGLMAFASLALGFLAFTRPVSRTIQQELAYEHLGVFSYSAPVPQNIYDADMLKSGDPIFTKLTCSVDLVFQYSLIAAQSQGIAGTYQLTALISEPLSGWHRAVPLQEKTAFSGTAFGTTARLDLCALHSLTQSMEQGTEFHPGSYLLSIQPNVQIHGQVADRLLESSFNSGLTFRYDDVQVSLVQSEGQEDPLVVTEKAALYQARESTNTMFLFGREVPIPTLRVIALCTLFASLGGLLLLSWKVQRLSQRDLNKFFHLKYDSLMIDVQNMDLISAHPVTDVRSIDALAKAAERLNTMILHTQDGARHFYFIQAGGSTYRFVLDPAKQRSVQAAPDNSSTQEARTV